MRESVVLLARHMLLGMAVADLAVFVSSQWLDWRP